MKKLIRVLTLLLTVNPGMASQLVDAGKVLQQSGVIKSLVEARQEELATARAEKALLAKGQAVFDQHMKTMTQECVAQLKDVAQQLIKNPEDEFLAKKRDVLKEQQGAVLDVQRERDTLLKTLDNYIGLLTAYLKDPEANEFKQELRPQIMPYTFETLEGAEQRIAHEKQHLEQAKKQKESLVKEQVALKVALGKDADAIAEIEQQQKAVTAGAQREGELFGFSAQQRIALMQLNLAMARLKKELDEIRAKGKEYEIAVNEIETRVSRQRLDALESLTYAAKSSVVTTLEQVEGAKQEAEKARQLFLSRKARFTQELDKLKKMHTEKGLALKALSAKTKISLGKNLQEWRWEPRKTPESYVAYTNLSALQSQLSLLEAREQLIERNIELERERVIYLNDLALIKETYYKLTARSFGQEGDIAKEDKKYADRKIELETIIKTYQTRKDEAGSLAAQIRNELLERVAAKRTQLQMLRETIFKNNAPAFASCLNSLEQAKDALGQRGTILESIEKTYVESSATLNKLIGHLDFIVSELKSITIWYRPGYAISLYGIKNIGTDSELFLSDVRAYVGQSTIRGFLTRVVQSFSIFTVWGLLLRILGLLCLLLLTIFLVPVVKRWLFSLSEAHSGWFKGTVLFGALVLAFVQHHSILVLTWLTIFGVAQVYVIQDPYFYILFYLVSIPYLGFLLYRFFSYFVVFNKNYAYVFVSEDFQQRLLVVVAALSYATLAIVFFRQAFMWAGFPRSELPTILLAVNFIMLQIALILLISKEQLLSIIPSRTDGWLWIRDQFDRFYYLIVMGVITIIVMSNPYVGYGRLVLFILSGVVYTLILVRVLIGAHSFFRKVASDLFFIQSEESVKERFPYAKTWFGTIIMASFFVLGIIGVFVAAKIWNWNVGVHEVRKFLTDPLLGAQTTMPITLAALIKIMGFVGMGIIASFVFHRFVLKKIFDLMLVDAGLQSAITSITRYALVVAFVLIGFEQVGLGGLIAYLAVLAAGASFIVKEPLGDLIAYFIILVQRPIRIGDYIKIDEETRGVVRKITPKAVVLRRKNSMTIMVPNNQIINKVITNWNYSRSFVATDDILIVISYDENPHEVKKVLLSVLEENPSILKTPKPVVRLNNFLEHGYQFMLRGYVSSNYTLDLWEISSELRMAVAARLKERGIAIATPSCFMVTSGTERPIKKSLVDDQQSDS